MTLTRLTPTKSIMRDSFFPAAVNSLFESMMSESALKEEKGAFFTPRTDIAEHESGYEIEVSLPGLKKDEIKIDMKHDLLTISGERKVKHEEKGKQFHKIESHYGSFSRSFHLPENANKESIEASFADGILHISIQKSQDAKPKTIEVK